MSSRLPRFPVMLSWGKKDRAAEVSLGCPKSIDWAIVLPHQQQALINHDQTLERLAERGGLAPCELCAVLEDRKWVRMPSEESVKRLIELLAERQPAA